MCEDKCDEVFVAILTGSQQVPPVTTTGSGFVRLVLDGHKLKVSGEFRHLESAYDVNVGSHIHLGLAGTNGPVIFPLVAKVSSNGRSGIYKEKNNKFTLTDVQVSILKNREYYVNVHTVANPAGSIRGQILPENECYYLAQLSGLNEVPGITGNTGARGTVILELDACRNLIVSGSLAGLSGSVLNGGVQINQGAVGQTGPVVFVLGLDPCNDCDGPVLAADILSSRNVYPLTCAQAKALKKGQYYVNVLTDDFPLGEIRGQVRHLKVSKSNSC